MQRYFGADTAHSDLPFIAAHIFLVKRITIFTAFFCNIQGLIGLSIQLFKISAVLRRQSDTDTARHLPAVIAVLTHSVQLAAQTFRLAFGRLGIADRAEDDELVTADTSDNILFTAVRLQELHKLLDAGIAENMPVQIVGLLKIIDVDDKEAVTAVKISSQLMFCSVASLV